MTDQEFDLLKSYQEENRQLKIQLSRKNRKLREYKHVIRKQKSAIERLQENQRPKFRNGKRGTIKNG
ncbi:hypothetical protein BpsS140_00017 [Bacillus phage vB_BpsS-140]|nr:hypothetical protein BpsS140_00017 [Bacillus phage vB_BpsS-140]